MNNISTPTIPTRPATHRPVRQLAQVATATLALLAGAAFAQATAPATPQPAAAAAAAASTARGPASGAHRMGPGAMHGSMHGDSKGGHHGDMRHGDTKHGKYGGAHDQAAMQQRFDRHMAELKQSLQLTPAQDDAWKQFNDAMRPSAAGHPRHEPAAMEKLTTPQRLDQMQAMRKQHLDQMDKHEAATRAFYARLTPEQQKRFDAQTSRMMGGMKGHGDHPTGGHHGHHGSKHR